MHPMTRIITGLAAGLSLAHSAVAAPVGKVLVAVGDNSVVREGRSVGLRSGDEIQTGDTVQTGAASNVQVRFTDRSVVALRPNTAFRVEDYAYAADAENDRSFFNLLKGGMRTLTGLIGRSNSKNYQVKTPNATIGIRGTHYTLLLCEGGCRNADGSVAENGLYGTIVDGRIAVTNTSGEEVFGRDSYFVVTGPDARPRGLIAPPDFLADRLEGRRGSGRTAEAGDRQGSGESRLGMSISQRAGSLALERRMGRLLAFRADENEKLVDLKELAATASTHRASVALANLTDTFSTPIALPTDKMSGSVRGGELGYVVAGPEDGISALNPLQLMTGARSLDIDLGYSISAGSGKVNVTLSKLASSFVGPGQIVSTPDTYSADLAVGSQNVAWGISTTTLERTFIDGPSAGNTTTSEMTSHWLVATPPLAMPTSGVLSYSWIGGTTPTAITSAAHGTTNVGTLTSKGAVTMDFSTSKISVSPVSFTIGGSGSSYTVAVTAQPLTVSSSGTQGVNSYSKTFDPVTVAGVCTAGCAPATPSTAKVAPTFFGANARGVGLAIATDAVLQSGAKERVATVQVYRTLAP